MPAAAEARALIETAEPGTALSEHASKQVLAAYGIPTSRDVLVQSAAQFARAVALSLPALLAPGQVTDDTQMALALGRSPPKTHLRHHVFGSDWHVVGYRCAVRAWHYDWDAAHGVWRDDPRRLAFLLARYKFVAKMLAGARRVLEAGCADAFGTRIVRQEVPCVVATDFDPVFIEQNRARVEPLWPVEYRVHDFLTGPVAENFDGVYALDVIEHILAADEDRFVGNLAGSLHESGVCILGSPSLESQAHAEVIAETGDGFPERVTAFRDGMAAHGRFGRPCPACGTPIQRIRYAANEANYCPTCQTGGKLLADRALSRLLHGDWPKTLEELEERKEKLRSE